MGRLEVIKEVDTTSEDGWKEFRRAQKHERKGGRIGPAPLEILNDHVAINVEPETPISTVKGILRTLNFETSSSKAELRKAEAQMKRAFLTFHHKLLLLKSYWYMIIYTAAPLIAIHFQKLLIFNISVELLLISQLLK